jgi:hypothetical protein
VCVCSLSYPASKAHAPYCTVIFILICHIFLTLSHKRHDFRRKGVEYGINIMFFSVNFVWKSFHSKKNSELSGHKCIPVFMQRTCYSSQILMKLEWSQQIFEKYSKIHENPPSGSQVVLFGRTERRTCLCLHSSEIRNCANRTKKSAGLWSPSMSLAALLRVRTVGNWQLIGERVRQTDGKGVAWKFCDVRDCI